ncbi:MAG: outer membrane beta-barrel protein [Sutterellaceae bacterium]|nr:porin family protein [Burkholderiaceae bacterium]MCX7901310.1 porin family protein [Burkholderiaceae bacterium]MDW8429494.1 outer membrane beta-barrel protein [Sutterellaceae bacterium]
MHRKRSLAIAAVAALIVAAPAAQAQMRQNWGSYVGVAVGEPEFGDLGLKIYGGQQLLPNFGWEAAFTQFVKEKIRTPLGERSTDYWGLSVAAVGIIPLPQNFSVYGKLGLNYGRVRVRASGGSSTDGEFNPLIGVGGRYQLTPQVALRLEFEEFDQGNLLSFGISYRF